jgi:uncharacterized membrane protein YphA (DoxX/SURF4 family)
MRTHINLNYQTLYRSIILSVTTCATIFAVLYLLFVGLGLLFGSLQVFASVFCVCAGLGALFSYDADGFQWDNNPRIAIRQLRPESRGGRDV